MKEPLNGGAGAPTPSPNYLLSTVLDEIRVTTRNGAVAVLRPRPDLAPFTLDRFDVGCRKFSSEAAIKVGGQFVFEMYTPPSLEGLSI